MARNGRAQQPGDDTVAVARAEVERLNAQELKLGLLALERSGVLAEVRAARGRQVLDASDPSAVVADVSARIRALEDELGAIAEAASEALRIRRLAITAVINAGADAAERKAAQLDVDAANLEAESARLRKALESHDDWSYIAAPPVIPERGFGGQQLGGAPIVVDARGPQHERLRLAAQSQRTQAAQGRFRQPQQAGMLEADTVEDLVVAVHSDAMRIGPPVDAIVAWSEQAIAKERRRRSRITSGDGFVPIDAPMRFHLEWRNGAIDEAQSGIVRPEPVEVRAYLDSAADIAKLGPLSDEPAGADQLETAQVEE